MKGPVGKESRVSDEHVPGIGDAVEIPLDEVKSLHRSAGRIEFPAHLTIPPTVLVGPCTDVFRTMNIAPT
jgi:hypothetical protein